MLLTSVIEWEAATSLGRVAHAKAGIGVNCIVSNVQRLFWSFERKLRNATFTGGVNNFSVPLLVGLAGDHNDDYGDDDERKDNGNVVDDDNDDEGDDDLAGDHDVLGEVTTARISELLLDVFAPVAHLV